LKGFGFYRTDGGVVAGHAPHCQRAVHGNIVEPRAAGDGTSGTERERLPTGGRVLVWEPPHRSSTYRQLQLIGNSALTFHAPSEVALEFIAEGRKPTRLELDTRHLERHGAGWQEVRKNVDAPGGLDGGAGAIRGGNEREVNVVDPEFSSG